MDGCQSGQGATKAGGPAQQYVGPAATAAQCTALWYVLLLKRHVFAVPTGPPLANPRTPRDRKVRGIDRSVSRRWDCFFLGSHSLTTSLRPMAGPRVERVENSQVENSFFFMFWVDGPWSRDARNHFFPESARFCQTWPDFWPFFLVKFSLDVLGQGFFLLRSALGHGCLNWKLLPGTTGCRSAGSVDCIGNTVLLAFSHLLALYDMINQQNIFLCQLQSNGAATPNPIPTACTHLSPDFLF